MSKFSQVFGQIPMQGYGQSSGMQTPQQWGSSQNSQLPTMNSMAMHYGNNEQGYWKPDTHSGLERKK